MSTRFPIRADRKFVGHAVGFFGATAKRRYLQVTDDDLVIRLGWAIHHHFPLSTVQQAGPATTGAPDWGPTPTAQRKPRSISSSTYGARVYTSEDEHLFAALSSEGLVDVHLDQPTRVRLFLPKVAVSKLTVALEDPEDFLAVLGQAGIDVRE